MKYSIKTFVALLITVLTVQSFNVAGQQPEAKKLLIINADDFGMCNSFNIATRELLLAGDISSTSIMVPCPWFPEAAEFSRNNPEIGLGIHLTLTSEWNGMKWKPVTTDKDVSSLVDSLGYFYSNHADFIQNANPEHARIELENQIKIALAAGLTPNHLNDHMGIVSMMGEEMIKIALELSEKYNLPYRLTNNVNYGFVGGMPDVTKKGLLYADKKYKESGFLQIDYIATNSFSKIKGQTYEEYKAKVIEYLRTVQNGITEYFIHPSIESEEIKAISPDWEQRVFEYRVFSDPDVKKVIQEEGIELVNYSVLNGTGSQK